MLPPSPPWTTTTHARCNSAVGRTNGRTEGSTSFSPPPPSRLTPTHTHCTCLPSPDCQAVCLRGLGWVVRPPKTHFFHRAVSARLTGGASRSPPHLSGTARFVVLPHGWMDVLTNVRMVLWMNVWVESPAAPPHHGVNAHSSSVLWSSKGGEFFLGNIKMVDFLSETSSASASSSSLHTHIRW